MENTSKRMAEKISIALKNYKLLAVALGLQILQWATISRYSFWFDESYTSALLRVPYQETISLTAADVHPPLYYVLLKGWSALFGISDVALRSLSALLMSASIIILYFLVKKLINKQAATWAVLIASLGPLVVRYSQEARMYALSSVFLLIATYILVTIVQNKPAPAATKRLYWIGYSLAIAGALYTHYFSSLILVVHGLYIASQAGLRPKQLFEHRIVATLYATYRDWVLAATLAVVLYIPWLPTLIKQTQAVNEGFWIPGVNETSFLDTLSQLMAFQPLSRDSSILVLALASLGLVVLVGAAIVLVRSKTIPAGSVWLSVGAVAIVAAILFVLSALPGTASYYYARYFSQYAVLFYGGIGIILYGLFTYYRKYLILPIVATGLVLSLQAFGLSSVLSGTDKIGNQTHAAFELIRRQASPGDAIVASRYSNYYDALHYNDTGLPLYILTPEEQYGSLEPIFRNPQAIRSLDDIRPATDRVWYVFDWHNVISVDQSWTQVKLYEFGDNTRVGQYLVN